MSTVAAAVVQMSSNSHQACSQGGSIADAGPAPLRPVPQGCRHAVGREQAPPPTSLLPPPLVPLPGPPSVRKAATAA